MRKYLYLLLAISVMAVSCYKDNSTLDTNPLPDIKISIDGIDKGIVIGMLNDLILSPSIKAGDVDITSGLEYEWILNQNPKEFNYPNDFDVISTEKDLNYQVTQMINKDPYILSLRVTDKSTGFVYSEYWELTVSSTYGEGILVAYEEGGAHELGLIMDKDISYQFSAPEASIRTGLYEAGNGSKLSSKIKSLTYAYHVNNNVTWIATEDGDLLCLNNDGYNPLDKEMIFQPESFHVNGYYNAEAKIVAYSNDGIYSMIKNVDDRPTSSMYTFDSADMKPSNDIISSNSNSSAVAPHMAWYNETDGAFYGIGFSWHPMFEIKGKLAANSNPEVFDRSNLPGQEAIAGGVSYNSASHSFLLKDKTSGAYTVYSFTSDPCIANIASKIPESAKSIIDNAVDIFFMYDYAIMYVATETDVYAINYSSSNAVFNDSPQFSAPSGEKIAVAKLYQQGNYANNAGIFDYDDQSGKQELNNRAIYLATNKGDEGKVYVVPMVAVQASNGTLDQSKALSYEGFNKIIDITTQGITTF